MKRRSSIPLSIPNDLRRDLTEIKSNISLFEDILSNAKTSETTSPEEFQLIEDLNNICIKKRQQITSLIQRYGQTKI